MKTPFLSQYDIIIFDCDGVLIDVNLLKCEAFGKAVGGYSSEIVDTFVNYCRKTFGISRYVKFKEFLSDFANEPFQEEKYKIFLNNFAKICKEIYEYADITPGCENLLSELSNQNKNLYVASGSDEKELNEVFMERNLSKYFNGIFGSPKTKLECTSIILKNHPDKKAVFIGDAFSDMKTAKEHDIDFVYMSRYTVQSEEQDLICRKESKKVISTLKDLIYSSHKSENTKYVPI
ncbi:phosphoglycolate phosphatase-like HAD superfamily hydrolase [Neobacillus bataviensis]|uniref:Phosphoglycolate phosphatase-like HAD superfamily hydrolase n=1 Tax=Neobacillus bataviensis TaxID=220685 RepID=A0A561D6N0_9BACI|nr:MULTISPECIES: HAD hydrolase-like protein [Neobacillus]MCM3724902.1 HAD hydrolase-like protein [Neobacillus cucumis]TWD98897.1 phosphoglycolate phosphatase-like HAD superfamily hydrolase [Neobacillus bataviensis]